MCVNVLHVCHFFVNIQWQHLQKCSQLTWIGTTRGLGSDLIARRKEASNTAQQGAGNDDNNSAPLPPKGKYDLLYMGAEECTVVSNSMALG